MFSAVVATMASQDVDPVLLALLLLLLVPAGVAAGGGQALALKQALLEAAGVPSLATCDVLIDTKNYDHDLTSVLMENARGVIQYSDLAAADLNGTDLSSDCLVVAAAKAAEDCVAGIAEKAFDAGHKKTVLVLLSRDEEDFNVCDLDLTDMGYKIAHLKEEQSGLFKAMTYSRHLGPAAFKARHVKKHLSGKTLVVSIIGMVPYVTYTSPMGGTDVSAMDIMAEKFGFEFTFKMERAFGIYQMANGSYDGLAYSVGTRQSDIGIGQQHITHKRYQLVDYLPHMFGYALVLRSAQPEEVPLYENLYLPLGKYVWYFFFGTIAAIPLAYVMIESAYDAVSTGRACYEGALLTLSFVNEGAILHRWLLRPSYEAKRILAGTWLFSLAFLMNMYKSNLDAMVISVSYEKPLDTIDDFLASGKSWIITIGTAPYHLFKESDNPKYQAVFDRAILYHLENYKVPDWVREKKLSGEAVISGDPVQALTEPDPDHFGSQVFLRSYAAWSLPKGSPLKSILWKSVRTLTDSGILEKLKRDGVSKARGKIRPKLRTSRPLEVKDLATTFLVWLGGAGLGLIAYGCEMAHRRCDRAIEEVLAIEGIGAAAGQETGGTEEIEPEGVDVESKVEEAKDKEPQTTEVSLY